MVILRLFVILGVLAFSIGPAMAKNRLAQAASPYLVAHADNPVDWFPWGAEALEKARREEKPIFLSIGYASCHFCHVMARETFENEAVAAILNQNFVSILVDREERPDLDHYFMDVLVAMNKSGGWPVTLFLTPDLVPLFGAGALAPEPKFGQPGFLDVARALAADWSNNRSSILANVGETRAQFKALAAPVDLGTAAKGVDPHAFAVKVWADRVDLRYGGFGRDSKFLQPTALSLLLRAGVKRHDKDLVEKVSLTLDHMAAGGIRDPLSGAFFRYASDRFWQVPHFEVMLLENALMANLYLEAYQATGKARYAAVARGVLDDILARLRLPEGGFASGLDAESNGEEGAAYTWTPDEVRAVLGDGTDAFLAAYLDPQHGTVRGRGVLRVLAGPEASAETDPKFASSRARLLEARTKRPPPPRDDKAVTSWNAIAVSAFAKAAGILNDARYLDVAQEEARHLLVLPWKNGALRHIRTGGTVGDAAFVDDYAFLAQALLDLYEADFDPAHLDRAHSLMAAAQTLFQGRQGTPFQIVPLNGMSDIPAQTILIEDGAPSGNAAALTALSRLALFSGDEGLIARVRELTANMGRFLSANASAAPGLLLAWDFQPGDEREVVIMGRLKDRRTQALLAEVRKRLLPGTVTAVLDPDSAPDGKWLLLAPRPLVDEKPTAYVCHDRRCDFPVTEARALAAQLE